MNLRPRRRPLYRAQSEPAGPQREALNPALLKRSWAGSPGNAGAVPSIAKVLMVRCYIHIYIYIYTCVSVYMYMYVYVRCIYVYMGVYMYAYVICIHVYMCVCVYIYICICIPVHGYRHVCVCIYIYAYSIIYASRIPEDDIGNCIGLHVRCGSRSLGDGGRVSQPSLLSHACR